MDRIDALAEKGDERLLVLSGEALSRSPDAELQQIVAEVVETIESPIALVSLVLKRTQFFRAQVGLPPALAQTAATDRDVSFCQFVVRDEAPLVVHDAEQDPSVPQLLVREYGVRSYLGVPIRVGGEVVGSLCAVDGRPRAFSRDDVAELEALAERASRRLGQLASARRYEAFGRALTPALAEVRNILTPMLLGLSAAEAALAELGARGGPAVLLLSTVLTAFTASCAGRPLLEVVGGSGEVRFELHSEAVDGAEAAELVERLASELPDTEGVTLRADGPRIVLAMQRA